MIKNLFNQKNLLVIIALIVFLIRIPSIGMRGIHIDEGMGIRASEFLLEGQWIYSPHNGHGATLFVIGSVIRKFLGTDIIFYRILTSLCILFSILILWLVYRKKMNQTCSLILIAGLGLSSAMLFFGNYFIHESLFILMTVLALACAEKFLETNKGIWISAFIISCSLMFMTKETAVLTFGTWTIAGVSLLFLKNNFKKFRQKINLENILFALFGILIATVLYLLMFGTNTKLLEAPFLWLQERATIFFVKPWNYFLILLVLHEPFMIFLGLSSVFALTIKKLWNQRTAFLFIWFIYMLAFYSTIPYKMPWLIMNIILPLGIFSAFSFSSIYEAERNQNKILFILLASILLIVSSFCMLCDNFLHPNRTEEYDYAYLQSGSGLKQMTDIIESISKQNSGKLQLQIIGFEDELLYVLMEKYDNVQDYYVPGFPLYIDYKHSTDQAEEILSKYFPEYVFLQFTYFTPGQDINVFIRKDRWAKYASSSDYIKPKSIMLSNIMRYE
jgi:uncharacterized protein (TIGR03663 family)